jgi:hypothetical protein
LSVGSAIDETSIVSFSVKLNPKSSIDKFGEYGIDCDGELLVLLLDK